MKSQTLNIIVWKEKNIYVAKFLELELASQGKTKQEALKNLKEALDLYMEDDEIGKFSFNLVENVSTQKMTVN